MKKKAILFTSLAVACVVVILLFVCNATQQKGPVNNFKEYLEQNDYSCSKYTCTMKSERTEDDITETYTEVYHLKKHTFTATWVQKDSSNAAVWQMEFIYNYADDTVTMKRYETADACKKQKPDTVYLMNNEEMLECVQGDYSDSQDELSHQMIRFKNVFKEHLEKSGVTVKDITL